ncbi:hypothetical protein POX80_21960 [Escherichia coli]|jgi:hypothetical protein|uniref:Uncharacterized protein n=7 Tax=Enterobacteriaceae TaxID=543 RepID=A0A759BGE4_SALER|nr:MULTISPECIES: hypothetical protein [Bacteria]EAA5273222.1 hypothetical protein [Salmonella enterica subsp. enterica serovar Infantis]EBV5481540.1 hypothetical protein [Salmonella enterica subsp. enterica serovar Saintpaul]ECZ0175095.1 hypothetical protein [Salmonella enterica subsp. enterica serovar Kentucky]EDQ7913901.1 hypothetical protein [Salmonella enterica subsp. enterica serovar Mississippi]EDZ3518758.1 hypothetical protein [Salmonella enterica]EED7370409.1 hypothetical protein [Sal
MSLQSIKEDIKRKFNQSLYVVTELLLDIALIESLKVIKIDQKQIKKLLQVTGSYFIEKNDLIYDETVIRALEKDNINREFIVDLLRDIQNDNEINTDIDLTNFLDAMKKYAKDNVKEYILLDSGLIDNYEELINKSIDFILEHVSYMQETIDLIKKSESPNKEKMLQITYFSYARTTATYVDDASKEFIRGAYSICHRYILKELLKKKNTQKSICEVFEDNLNNVTNKGIGSVKYILKDFFGFPETFRHYSNRHDLEKRFLIYKNFAKYRNKIVHENVIEPEKFNYIMGNFDKCDKFFYSVLELYNSNENQELLIEEIVNLCSKIANERSDILEKLYEKSKDYLPYSYN